MSPNYGLDRGARAKHHRFTHIQNESQDICKFGRGKGSGSRDNTSVLFLDWQEATNNEKDSPTSCRLPPTITKFGRFQATTTSRSRLLSVPSRVTMMMMMIKYSLVVAAVCSVEAFAPLAKSSLRPRSISLSLTDTDVEQPVQTKPTGTSFLPQETIERAKQGSPLEKIKLEKDGTAAFVDVYEYARKIREREMTWEEVEKADLDTVRRAPLR